MQPELFEEHTAVVSHLPVYLFSWEALTQCNATLRPSVGCLSKAVFLACRCLRPQTTLSPAFAAAGSDPSVELQNETTLPSSSWQQFATRNCLNSWSCRYRICCYRSAPMMTATGSWYPLQSRIGYHYVVGRLQLIADCSRRLCCGQPYYSDGERSLRVYSSITVHLQQFFFISHVTRRTD